MKTVRTLLFGLFLIAGSYAEAQVNVNVNVGAPPAWGPAGYNQVRYYYIPDIYTYYDVSNRQYIYMTNGKWTRATVLPAAYRNYNLYNGYKVVLNDYRGTTPYVYYTTHKAKYPKGYKAAGKQKTIGLPPGQAKKIVASRSTSKKHYVSPGNGNVQRVKSNGNGKGHANGKGKGKKD